MPRQIKAIAVLLALLTILACNKQLQPSSTSYLTIRSSSPHSKKIGTFLWQKQTWTIYEEPDVIYSSIVGMTIYPTHTLLVSCKSDSIPRTLYHELNHVVLEDKNSDTKKETPHEFVYDSEPMVDLLNTNPNLTALMHTWTKCL